MSLSHHTYQDTSVLATKPTNPQTSRGSERLNEAWRQVCKSDEEKQENKIQNKERKIDIERQRAVK